MKKVVFIILMASSFSYSSPCKNTMASFKTTSTKNEPFQLEHHLEQLDVNARLKAVQATGKIGQSAIPLLIQFMKNSNVDVRLMTVQVAGQIGKPALTLLKKALQDSDMNVRSKAFEELRKLGEPLISLFQSEGLSVLEKPLQELNMDMLFRDTKSVEPTLEPAFVSN